MKHFNIHIYGLVQGVFFRANTETKANELNLKGFVRNEADGSVYIEIEGDSSNLDKFVGWCQRGTEGANVERVEVEKGKISGYSSYKIKF